ncbi:MAG: zf-HC2 domain-containing protein [Dehalococcoidia bacterium]
MSLRDWYRKLPWAARPGLACREVVQLVTDYLEGALPTGDRQRFEAHLGACPGCSRYMSQFRQTISATGRLSEEDISPEAKEALLSAFRNWKAS